MSYQDEEFYQPDLDYDPEDYVLVDFDVYPTSSGLMDRVYREIPAESSVGTWQKVAAMTDNILKNLSAKTVQVNRIKDDFSKIKVAYPVELFEPNNIPQMMSLFAGNVYGMNTVKYLKISDIRIPQELIRSYPGPAFGPEGIYDIIGIDQGPILGTIVKPKLGSPPDIHAQTTYDSWRGSSTEGIIWVKDDEPQTNQDFCPFEDRISRVLEFADQIKEETGRQVIYACNITGPVDTMLKRAEFVKDHGGKCLMIDVITTGFAGVQYIREQEFGMPIHGHRAMHGAITKHPNHGIHMRVLAKVYRLTGVDGIHTGTAGFGKMGVGDKKEDLEETLDTNKALLREDFGGLKRVIPIASGGVGVNNVGKIIQALAPHVVITAGGGIHGHPNGTRQGATSMVQAKEAALNGIVDPDDLYRWAKENDKTELKIALEKLDPKYG